MTRGWMLVLLLTLFVAPFVGCRAEVDTDDDADLNVKVDNEGKNRGVKIDAD